LEREAKSIPLFMNVEFQLSLFLYDRIAFGNFIDERIAPQIVNSPECIYSASFRISSFQIEAILIVGKIIDDDVAIVVTP